RHIEDDRKKIHPAVFDVYEFLDEQYGHRSQVAECVSDIDEEADVTRYPVSGQHPLEIEAIVRNISEVKSCGGRNDPGDRGDQMEVKGKCGSRRQRKPADDDDIVQQEGAKIV